MLSLATTQANVRSIVARESLIFFEEQDLVYLQYKQGRIIQTYVLSEAQENLLVDLVVLIVNRQSNK